MAVFVSCPHWRFKNWPCCAGHVEVNNEWVSAIVKDKFSDRNFLDASGALEPRRKTSDVTKKTYGCVWKWLVPHCTQWFSWSLSLLNGYFIGNINPTFSDKAIWHEDLAIVSSVQKNQVRFLEVFGRVRSVPHELRSHEICGGPEHPELFCWTSQDPKLRC